MTNRSRIEGGHRLSSATRHSYAGGALPPPYEPSTSSYSGQPVGFVRAMDDVVTPGWRAKLAKGDIINNPMTSVSLNVVPSNINNSIRQVVGTLGPNGYAYSCYDFKGDWLGRLLLPLTPNSDAAAFRAANPPRKSLASYQNEALINAWKFVDPNLSLSLVTYFEGHKTLNMLQDRVRKLADVIQLVRGRKRQQLEFMFPRKQKSKIPKRIIVWDHDGSPILRNNGKPDYRYSHPKTVPTPSRLDEATRLWLEYRYGWSPLVHDIVDTAKALYAADLRKDLNKPLRVTARGFGKGHEVVNSIDSVNNGAYQCNRTAIHDIDCRAYILYVAAPNESIRRRLDDFGLFDVPETAWELVPYSFIIDWFVPIGDFLGAWTPRFDVDIIASGLVTKYTLSVKRELTRFDMSPSSGNLAWSGPSIPLGTSDSAEMVFKNRSTARLYPTFPPIKVKLDLKRMVDAVSLLRQMRSSNPQTFLRK